MAEDIVSVLKEKLPKNQIRIDEPMSNHTTLRLGGKADYFVCPENEEQLQWCLTLCKDRQLPVYFLGKGSNVLVGDLGFRGMIIHFPSVWNEVSINGPIVFARAGVTLESLATTAANASLSGLEFAYGIPGTLGGALAMNAGAYGEEIARSVIAAEVISAKGEKIFYKKEDLDFSYRYSKLRQNGDIVCKAFLCLTPTPSEEVWGKMHDLKLKRQSKQPLEYPSAGSIFKRPEGHFASQLIEQAGLKGYRIGGACVSTKHAGFLINDNHATAKEFLSLIHFIQKTIKEKFLVDLDLEVQIIGEF